MPQRHKIIIIIILPDQITRQPRCFHGWTVRRSSRQFTATTSVNKVLPKWVSNAMRKRLIQTRWIKTSIRMMNGPEASTIPTSPMTVSPPWVPRRTCTLTSIQPRTMTEKRTKQRRQLSRLINCRASMMRRFLSKLHETALRATSRSARRTPVSTSITQRSWWPTTPRRRGTRKVASIHLLTGGYRRIQRAAIFMWTLRSLRRAKTCTLHRRMLR